MMECACGIYGSLIQECGKRLIRQMFRQCVRPSGSFHILEGSILGPFQRERDGNCLTKFYALQILKH